MSSVTTIIVTYNGSTWIKRCIDALLESSHPTSILVLDNASTDDTLSILQSYEDRIRLIPLNENKFFGGANNIGIIEVLQSPTDYIFLLNQDAYVEKDTIGQLVQTANAHPELGIVCPMQMAPNGIDVDRAFKKYLKKETNKDGFLSVRFANAAAWLIPTSVVWKVGLFHPIFLHYGEDNHYASRCQYHGYKIAVLPDVKVIHDRSQFVDEPQKLYLRQLRTIPLYTILDLRKPYWLARCLGQYKYKRLVKKLQPMNAEIAGTVKDVAQLINNDQWMKQIREETKQIGFGI